MKLKVYAIQQEDGRYHTSRYCQKSSDAPTKFFTKPGHAKNANAWKKGAKLVCFDLVNPTIVTTKEVK